MTLVAEFLRATYVSYTRVDTFRKCPLRFKMTYLDGRQTEPCYEAQLGKLVHAVIERYLQRIQGRPATYNPKFSDLFAFFPSASKELRSEGELTKTFIASEIEPFLSAFVKLMPVIDGRSISEVESTKNVKLGPWKYKSVLDLVLVRRDGKKQIVDFKTGNPDNVTLQQLKTYSLSILGNCSYGLNEVDLTYVFLRTGSIRSFSMRKDQTQKVVNLLAEKIEKIEACNDFPARVSPGCEWCSVKRTCEAYLRRT